MLVLRSPVVAVVIESLINVEDRRNAAGDCIPNPNDNSKGRAEVERSNESSQLVLIERKRVTVVELNPGSS